MIKSIFKKALLVFLASFALIQTLYAENAPYRVYYVSLGGVPGQIPYYFQNGIISPGSDFNLMDLLSGNAIERTAYLPTISNLSTYLRIAGRMMAKQGIPSIVIYTIRPAQNFYSANCSLEYSAHNMQFTNPELSQHLELLLENQLISGFGTWVVNSIPREQIESATVYELVNTTLVPVSTLSNSNYVKGKPSVNPAPISITNGPDEFIKYGDLEYMRTLPGEFCGTFSNSRSKEQQAAYQLCTKHTYSNLKFKVMTYFVVLNGIL